ncbi:MAG: hypothetical protein JWQ28_2379 [Pedobacter sp.]|jgi:hypothetical protein|nr:hypothetical protein [Pedobacter sp.]
MGYKLRYVQIFKQEKAKQYLEIEKQFEKYELGNPEVPKGKRYIPCSGRDASNTLIWECDFPSLEEAQKAQAFFLTDSRHEDLFQLQSEYIVATFTEIYRPFDS